MVSRIGLPLSSVSTRASRLRFDSILSAILFRISDRSPDRGLAPRILGLVRRVERQLDIFSRRPRHFAELLAVTGLGLSKYRPATGQPIARR